MDAIPIYLKSLSETIQAEAQKHRPNFMELYRAHAQRLREIAQQGNQVATWLLRDLLLAQTSPDPEVDDTRDGYTGEKLPICRSGCENFEGTPDGEYRCKTGIPCLLGELCPWEDEPHIPQGSLTWRNVPLPGMTLGVSTSGIEEEYRRYQEVSTASLCAEDDIEPELRTHWRQTFDDWDELREFREEMKPDYDHYYEELTRDYDETDLLIEDIQPWQIPAFKFGKLVGNMTDILDRAVDEFLRMNISEMTLSVIFYRMVNGVALDFRPRQGAEDWEVEWGQVARELRRKYQQWLLMVADHIHLIPDSDPPMDWLEEDEEMIARWVEYFNEQEKKAHQTEVEWEAAMAYRSAACHGSPQDARRAAKQVRSDHRKSYLASVDQYIETCWRPT